LGPFTEVSNLSLGSGICICFASKAHLPTSAPLFRAGHTARYPASYPPTIREEFPVLRSAVSCCLSAAGLRFLGTLSHQTEFRPPHGRPTATGIQTRTPAADPGRVYTFHTYEIQTGPGALSTPRMTVFANHRKVRGRRLPPLNGRSLSPRNCYPTRDVLFSRHQQEFPGSRPIPVFPLVCGHHGWIGSPWTFPRCFAPDRSGTGHARRGGDGSNTNPSLRFRHTSNLLNERTHHV
jgi:hypothetical protein